MCAQRRCATMQRDRDEAEAEAERDALQRFKDFVHRRLDEAGVPAHPDGPHSKEGCRIGDRLDLLFGDRDALRAELAQLRPYADALNARCVADTAELGALRAELAALKQPDLNAKPEKFPTPQPAPAPTAQPVQIPGAVPLSEIIAQHEAIPEHASALEAALEELRAAQPVQPVARAVQLQLPHLRRWVGYAHRFRLNVMRCMQAVRWAVACGTRLACGVDVLAQLAQFTAHRAHLQQAEGEKGTQARMHAALARSVGSCGMSVMPAALRATRLAQVSVNER